MLSREVVQSQEGRKRIVRTDEHGQFTDKQAKAAKSLSADRRQTKMTVPKGPTDRGYERNG